VRTTAVVLGVVVALSVATPSFAADITRDVPFTHWAYDAVQKLVDLGIIEGYPDETFKGDRAMTRYEFAMAVARLWDKIPDLQGERGEKGEKGDPGAAGAKGDPGAAGAKGDTAPAARPGPRATRAIRASLRARTRSGPSARDSSTSSRTTLRR
jgi:hypothetical protein